MSPSDDGFWVFGYGSLMWRPGFAHVERRMAHLPGYARRFVLRSVRYRGTPEAPGLVLGLDWDPDEVCTGIAFRVAHEAAREARAYLHRREMGTRSYIELCCPVRLLCDGPGQGGAVEAMAYVLDRTHRQYAGGLPLGAQAEVIARSEGPAGPNADYLHNTVAHLREMGVSDPGLEALDARVRAIRGR